MATSIYSWLFVVLSRIPTCTHRHVPALQSERERDQQSQKEANKYKKKPEIPKKRIKTIRRPPSRRPAHPNLARSGAFRHVLPATCALTPRAPVRAEMQTHALAPQPLEPTRSMAVNPSYSSELSSSLPLPPSAPTPQLPCRRCRRYTPRHFAANEGAGA
jgi:hypothetical protein